jgi:5-methylcytosine-specific restriction protein B
MAAIGKCCISSPPFPLMRPIVSLIPKFMSHGAAVMREAEFRAWLAAQDYEDATVVMQVNRVRRIEENYGDLDALVTNGGLEKLQQQLAYSKTDERAQKPNPAKFPVDGNIYNNMATYRKTLDYYRQFSAGANVPQPNGTNVTGEAIEAAMNEFDAIGLDGFKSRYGFGTPQKYWVRRTANGQLYPAKAIVGVSHGHVAGGVPLKASDFYGGQGEQAANGILRKLGYEVVEKVDPGVPARPFVLFDAEGHEYQPTRTANRRTGISAFRLQKRGTSNRTDDADEVEAIIDVARAMLLEGRLARVRRTDGTGPANYIGYGKSKLVSYRLDVDLAQQLGVPEQGGLNDANRVISIDQKERGSMPRPMTMPTNLILYGPPGTGKTYVTALEAVKLCDGVADYAPTKEGRTALMTRYNELVTEKRIGFVTFHQNYGYEDFVEGLRPVAIGNSDGESVGFHLQPEPGVFRLIAERAETGGLAVGNEPLNIADLAVYKMSLGEVADSASDFVFKDSIQNNYALLGFHDIDWSDQRFSDRDEIFSEVRKRYPDVEVTPNKGVVQSPDTFRNQLEVGDMLIIAKGNHRFRAIGIVEGEYEYAPRPDGRYCHRRKVRWLWHDKDGLDVVELYPPKFIQKTIYRLKDAVLNRSMIARLISDAAGQGTEGEPLPHVLIVDEINRANVSKVFGELITLLESDKRAGMPNALSVILPYSKRQFSVPANLHIIGTMNTADRSIALLDTALRRRFTFREMAPNPGLLADASKQTGINLVRVLTIINQRIEYLIDREHRIGHAFFIGCETAEQTYAAMRDKVIPLLQEYFFEDWSRIHAVLGDGFIREDKLDPPPGVEGDRVSSWSVLAQFKSDAFDRLTGKVASTAAEPDD